jgi:DNA-binding transcriptional regulator YdaS (Cro superfamily)
MGRLLGVSQPTVWAWLRKGKPLPAEYVLKVEAATGISRHQLRPDLYPPEEAAVRTIPTGGTPGSCERRGKLQLGEPAR